MACIHTMHDSRRVEFGHSSNSNFPKSHTALSQQTSIHPSPSTPDLQSPFISCSVLAICWLRWLLFQDPDRSPARSKQNRKAECTQKHLELELDSKYWPYVQAARKVAVMCWLESVNTGLRISLLNFILLGLKTPCLQKSVSLVVKTPVIYLGYSSTTHAFCAHKPFRCLKSSLTIKTDDWEVCKYVKSMFFFFFSHCMCQ